MQAVLHMELAIILLNKTYLHTCIHTNLTCVLQVLERGERIELLVDKTDHLQSESFAFKRDARQLRQSMWWQNTRWMIALGALILLIVYILIAVFCSPTLRC